MQAGLQARGAGREGGRARDLLHDSSWHSREEEAEREREKGAIHSHFPVPLTHSIPFPRWREGREGGRQVAAAATAGCRWRQLKGGCAI